MIRTERDEWVLAIDFGTTATAAALSVGGAQQIVDIDDAPKMSSMLCWKGASNGTLGRLLLGEAAENEAVLAPECVERCPKRKLGQDHIQLGDERIRVTDAVGQVFLEVIGEATARQGGRPPRELRLTHPARWGETLLSKLREAAAFAGFGDPLFLPEPVGAAVYFAGELLATGEHVAVYDLGGGTFDTAVLRRTDAAFEVVGRPGGRDDLGGEDFDERLYRLLALQLDPVVWQMVSAVGADVRWQRAHHDFRRDVRRAKERLSKYADATVRSPIPGHPDLRVSAAEFEALIGDDIETTINELERTIAEAGMSVADLSAIYLAGGSSRIPIISRRIADRLGKTPDLLGDPKAVVALGAARARLRMAAGRALVASDAPSNGSERIAAGESSPSRGPADAAANARQPSGGQSVGGPVAEGVQGHVRAADQRAHTSAAKRSSNGVAKRQQARIAAAAPTRPGETQLSQAAGVLGGGAVLAAIAGVLLLVDALARGLSAGLIAAQVLGIVRALLLLGGFATGAAAWAGLLRDRARALRRACGLVAAGFSASFVSELVSAVVSGLHQARAPFLAAHAMSGLAGLLGAGAVMAVLVALTAAARSHSVAREAALEWAGVIAASSFVASTAGSLLYLVTYSAGSGRAAVTSSIAAQVAGQALAAGACVAAVAAVCTLTPDAVGTRRATATRVGILASAVIALGLAFAITGLGTGIQVAATHGGTDARTIIAGGLGAAQELIWGVAAGLSAAGLLRLRVSGR